jgi:hypothetical protein
MGEALFWDATHNVSKRRQLEQKKFLLVQIFGLLPFRHFSMQFRQLYEVAANYFIYGSMLPSSPKYFRMLHQD